MRLSGRFSVQSIYGWGSICYDGYLELKTCLCFKLELLLFLILALCELVENVDVVS